MTYSDIKQKVYLLTSANSVSIPSTTMAILANNALERIEAIIMKSDGRWQFDDENNTDLPIATTDIVSGQQDYSLSVAHLSITRAEIMDTAGNWTLLNPLDQQDVYSQSLTDFMKTAGLPTCYDKLSNSLFLYPIPNYSQSSSLKLWFKRGPNYFVGDGSDETKSPGFNSMYHDLISYWIAYDYSLANGLSNLTQIMQTIQMKETALMDDYALRDKTEHIRLQARQNINFRGFFR